MAKQICMIDKHSMEPMQYAEIHALPYKYNVCLSQDPNRVLKTP